MSNRSVSGSPISPIILAVDSTDLVKVQELIEDTRDAVTIYKFGLEFYLKFGKDVLQQFIDQFEIEIFLDLKLHDIPNTVQGACRSISSLNPYFLTVHASGGQEMIKAAVRELPASKIAAVTVLTSLDHSSLKSLGISSDIAELVYTMANQSFLAGAEAIVCSPLEVAMVKTEIPSLITITPGIRGAGSSLGDQLRTLTPEEARKAGSDFLVIGRPITQAENPGKAALEILQSIQ
jgi:orotidine-5'-phosphate decarboxylase